MRYTCFVTALAICLLLMRHEAALGATPHDNFRQRNNISAESTYTMKNIDIQDRFEKIDPDDLPDIVVLTEAENTYVTFIADAIFDALAGARTLEEKDQVFGTGQYHWPKDPNAATKLFLSYRERNFRLRNITASFRRETSDGNWTYAYFSVHPRNFPSGAFEMKLFASPFTNLKLQRTFREKRPDDAIKEVNVFVYTAARYGVPFRVVLESSPTVSDLGKTSPQSFHFMSVERIGK